MEFFFSRYSNIFFSLGVLFFPVEDTYPVFACYFFFFMPPKLAKAVITPKPTVAGLTRSGVPYVNSGNLANVASQTYLSTSRKQSHPTAISEQLNPVNPNKDMDDLVKALAQLTTVIAADREAARVERDQLATAMAAERETARLQRERMMENINALQATVTAQQGTNTLIREAIENVAAVADADPAVAPISATALERVPIFSGGVNDDVEDWVGHLDRVAELEEWNNQRCRQVAIRRLKGTALLWHETIGSGLATWNLWRTSLTAHFRQRLTSQEFARRVEARVQQPGESGMAYALEKAKLCARSPVTLTNGEIVAHLINGLAKWEQVSSMTHAPPADVAAFITRIRELEESGVRPRVFDQFLNRGVEPATSETASLSAISERLRKLELGQKNRSPSPLRSTSPVRSSSPGRDQTFPPRCYECGNFGHIAKFCTQKNSSASGNGEAGLLRQDRQF